MRAIRHFFILALIKLTLAPFVSANEKRVFCDVQVAEENATEVTEEELSDSPKIVSTECKEAGDKEEGEALEAGSKALSAKNPERQGRLLIFGVGGVVQLNHFEHEYDNGEKNDFSNVSPRSRTFFDITSKNIVARLGVDMSRLFANNSLDLDDDFDMGTFLSDATIDIRNINGQVSAIIIGKQVIPFGLRPPNLPPPSSWNDPIHAVRFITDVIGVSVELIELPGLQTLVDSIEASVFESSQFDFDIDGGLGFSIRLRKNIFTSKLDHELSASYLKMENDHLPFRRGPEERVSVGIITETSMSEKLYAWAEWLYFKNHWVYYSPESQAFTLGLTSTIFDEDTYWSSEAVWADDYTSSFATSVWRRVRQRMGLQVLLGAEYRHARYEEAHYSRSLAGKSDNSIGLSTRLLFYKTKAKRTKPSHRMGLRR